MDNVKYKPGGGDIKIFDDKDYIKQMTGHSPQPDTHGHSRQEVRPAPGLPLSSSVFVAYS